jgi:hypothetical protein
VARPGLLSGLQTREENKRVSPASIRTWEKEGRPSVDVVHTGLSLFNETDKWVPSWSTECSLDGAAQWGSSLSLPVAREWGAARQKEEEAAENISRSQK